MPPQWIQTSISRAGLITGSFSVAGTAEEEAYVRVLSDIRGGTYAPGDRLVPEVIASTLEMSRMPVREALRRLDTEGIVTIRPNRGCVVTVLNGPEIEEVFEIRSVLEGLAVRLAMPRLLGPALNRLEDHLVALEASEAAGSDAWIVAHSALHEALCAPCERPKLLRQIRSLLASIEPYLRMYFERVEKPRSPATAHHALMDVIRGGDADAAEAAMRAHVRGTAPMLLAFLAANGGIRSGRLRDPAAASGRRQ